MLPDASVLCPYTAFKKRCRDLASGCPKFIHIIGADPQTGGPVDKYGCADSFQHMLTIENTREQRRVAGEIEALRKETVALGRASIEMNARALQLEGGIESPRLLIERN